MKRLTQIANVIDWLNENVGKAVAWVTTALVLLICIDVIFRYLLNSTAAWVIELEWHLFALIFLLGGGFALKHDRHVRVDLFYTNFSKRDKAWLNLWGSLFLLLPWSLLIAVYASKYASRSFQMNESSPDPGGLSALYIIKFMIVIGFFLLFLQGIALAIRSILTLQDQ